MKPCFVTSPVLVLAYIHAVRYNDVGEMLALATATQSPYANKLFVLRRIGQ